ADEASEMPGLEPDGSLLVHEAPAMYEPEPNAADHASQSPNRGSALAVAEAVAVGAKSSPSLRDDGRVRGATSEPHLQSGRGDAQTGEAVRAPSVTFVFRESGDQASDRDRLTRLHQALSRWQGADSYIITLDGARGRRQIVGDELLISFCPELQSEVEAILGQGCVRRN